MALLTRRLAAAVGVAGCMGAALLCAPPVHAQPPASTLENEVKAAFLYNFAKYVEWPPTAFQAGNAFRICVLADPAFVGNIDSIVAGETIDGRTVSRQIPESAEAARSCQILFVGRSDLERAQRLLAAVQGSPVLTVGDAPDFLSRGGAITFVRDGDRVRFDVNVGVAERSGLAISSRLLRVARRVSPLSPRR